MNNIPIFDSLTHPMPDKGWLQPKYDGRNSIDNLREEMKGSNVRWAFAVGMGNEIGGYEEHRYASFIIEQSEALFPVAFFDFRALSDTGSVRTYLQKLKRLNYVGIKIHPVFSGIAIADPRLPEVIREANGLGLTVLFCTYFWSKSKTGALNSPEQLSLLLSEVPDDKVILLHGGAVRLLEVAEIVRSFGNTMLDLSFTLCKFEGSSLDLDIRFLFSTFDQRVCIGSDSPEFSPVKLRGRFEALTEGLDERKKKNIAYRNIQDFTGLAL